MTRANFHPIKPTDPSYQSGGQEGGAGEQEGGVGQEVRVGQEGGAGGQEG